MILSKDSIHIFPAIIISIIIGILIFYLHKLIQKSISKLSSTHQLAPQIVHAIQLVAKFFIYFFGLILILENLHIQISALFGTFGIIAVGVGLALQNILVNMTSGILILYQKPFFVGDYISINNALLNNNIEGVVTDISLSNTEIKFEKNKFIIPNNLIYSSVITVREED